MLLLSTSILTYCSFYKNKIVFYIELFPYNEKRLIKNRFFIKKVDMLYISYTNGYKVILEKLYKKYKKNIKKVLTKVFMDDIVLLVLETGTKTSESE